MAGLAGLVRARQYIWISDEVNKMLNVELPFDDGMNECPHIDVLRCLHGDEAAQSADGHPAHVAHQPAAAGGMADMAGMGSMAGMPGMQANGRVWLAWAA